MRPDWKRVCALAAWLAVAPAAGARAQSQDLTSLPIEDLLKTPVTSAERKEQPLARTAAALHVITREDIRRSGAQSIPDLLRSVPGIAVAQVDATTWAISARGFNGVYADKILVLIDGRSVYSPLFGGVHWDMQNLPLGEIERIEVIRGPGGSLWGVNAVNGVINIITRQADTTQGGVASVGAGSQERGRIDVRFGGRMGGGTYYRVYGQHAARGGATPLAGFDRPDRAGVTVGGVRIDRLGAFDRLTFNAALQQGDGSHVRRRIGAPGAWGGIGQVGTEFADGSAVLSWTRSVSSRSEFAVQGSYQRYTRTATDLRERWHILEFEGRHRHALGRRHDVNVGAGFRYWTAAVRSTPTVALTAASPAAATLTAFVHDDVMLTKRLHVSAGTKLEHTPFTGVQAQPSARLTWTARERHALWTSISRVVRTPSVTDRTLDLAAGISVREGATPLLVSLHGNPDMRPEVLRALEAGYRFQAGAVSIDATVFTNQYDRLRSWEPGVARQDVFLGTPVLRMPTTFGNLMTASAAGVEVCTIWRPLARWKISGSYGEMRLQAARRTGSGDNGAETLAGSVPQRQVALGSYMDLPGGFDASTVFYGVGGLRAFGLPAYGRLDARLAWTLGKAELAAIARDVLAPANRVEIVEISGLQSVPARRDFSVNATWRF